MKDLGKHALWIYGAFVSLCIREALTSYFAHKPQSPFYYQESLELARLVLYLFVISRFFLGAADFFERVHGEGSEAEYPRAGKNFQMDFLVGMAHFVFFYVWALSITDHAPRLFGASNYLLLMVFILAYDLAWYIASKTYVTRKKIAPWVGINLLTVIAAAILWAVVKGSYFATRPDVTDASAISAEFVTFIPVVAMGVYDIRCLLRGKESLPYWLQKIIEAFEGRPRPT
jgi:hypothetical protein